MWSVGGRGRSPHRASRRALRRPAQTNPAAYLPDLAMSLNNLGIQLDAVGRWKEAQNEGESGRP
jgi:hypothetical protein